MFISVDLPEPLAPMIATNSPAVDLQRDAAHGVHRHLAGVVDLVDVLDFDDGRHGARNSRSGTSDGCRPDRRRRQRIARGPPRGGRRRARHGDAGDDDIALLQAVNHLGVDAVGDAQLDADGLEGGGLRIGADQFVDGAGGNDAADSPRPPPAKRLKSRSRPRSLASCWAFWRISGEGGPPPRVKPASCHDLAQVAATAFVVGHGLGGRRGGAMPAVAGLAAGRRRVSEPAPPGGGPQGAVGDPEDVVTPERR